MVDRKDNENVLIKLYILIVTEIKKENLPTNYKFLGNRIVYDETWD